MFITIDPYYDNQMFLESKEALKNNDIDFFIFINIKPPYNWYFKMQKPPIMVNHDVATADQERWMVQVINPARPAEEYLLLRRDNDNGAAALLKFIENEPLKMARKADYAVFFTIKNREEGITLSKEFPGKIWYFGKYYKNKYRICLSTHQSIRGFLGPEEILLERGDFTSPGRFEAELNYRVFRNKDQLIKFTETPYFEDGDLIRPKIAGKTKYSSSRFTI